jgi:U2 small nuclear ribonucleoprotein A'
LKKKNYTLPTVIYFFNQNPFRSNRNFQIEMVRLTPELIEDSYQYVNPVREYELNLRGYKIGLIENLGATLNQFDTIDFTDNDVRRLDGFPYLPKIKSLLFSNNKIQ